jgi:hypothetical protein
MMAENDAMDVGSLLNTQFPQPQQCCGESGPPFTINPDCNLCKLGGPDGTVDWMEVLVRAGTGTALGTVALQDVVLQQGGCNFSPNPVSFSVSNGNQLITFLRPSDWSAAGCPGKSVDYNQSFDILGTLFINIVGNTNNFKGERAKVEILMGCALADANKAALPPLTCPPL